MIGKLKGFVETIYTDFMIVSVMGIGFEVFLSSKDLGILAPQQEVDLFIHTQIRESDIALFGFLKEHDKKFFLQLIKTKGVGGKLALSILGQTSPHDLSEAIKKKDIAFFKQISGVGPKLAERIISELQGQSFDFLPFSPVANKNSSRDELIVTDAVSALFNLGYNKNEANSIALSLFKSNPNITLSELIRLSLRELSS
jgi:Holliday junction DNA helicase RuvA